MGNTTAPVHEDVLRNVRQIAKVATLSYSDFLECLTKLNSMCQTVSDSQLVFAVKRGTADTILWRSTIRIAIVLIDLDSEGDSNESLAQRYRLLTLPQFMKVFHSFETQFEAALTPTGSGDSLLTRERVLTELENATSNVENKLNECCVCLERKQDVILPCAHAFCLVCIEQWKEYQQNCPVCRETIETTDDAWVVSDIPGSSDIASEICTTLMNLSIPPPN